MPDPVQRIGSYEIVAQLKSGGMASLHLGRRTGAAGFARHVAIKVIHPHLASDPAFVRMFLDEAHLSARITHPNVVHVEELGEADGMYYLVMEYVHGCSLSQLARALAKRRRRLSPELATSIAIQIADGLHAAHETRGPSGEPLNVVHRDVSPQNVLLSYAGHVKLIDFGIAKARTRAEQTTTRSLKGKLRYMAPEQAFGRPVDRRTDVYALGIVLWELLTMRRLFDAEDDFAVLDQVRSPKVVPPGTFGDVQVPALDAAVMRALAPRPDRRFPSMQDFRRALVEALPQATALDSSHLSELLAVVMSDVMEDQRRSLPESLSGLGPSPGDAAAVLAATRSSSAPLQREPDEVIATLTARAAHAALRDDDEPALGSHVGPSVVTRSTRRPPRRYPAAQWIAGGALGVMALVGLGVAVGLRLGGGASPATTLHPAAAPASRAPGPPEGTAPPEPVVEAPAVAAAASGTRGAAATGPDVAVVSPRSPSATGAAPDVSPDQDGSDRPPGPGVAPAGRGSSRAAAAARRGRRAREQPARPARTRGASSPRVRGVPIVDDDDF